MHIRPLDPDDASEIELVAHRMRQTLVEVLGPEEGGSMYTLEWLCDRVRWHLDPARAEVWLAEAPGGSIAGHTIVRVDDGCGLFSTTWVQPEHRRRGVASALLARGEEWMRSRGLEVAATATSATNVALIGLYERHGYRIALRSGDMVRLERRL